MSNSAKTVSLHKLQTAVNTALETAKRKHPRLKIDPVSTGGSPFLPVAFWIPWLCGIPVPWPIDELQDIYAFNATFVTALGTNPEIAALGAGNKLEAALYVSGGKASIGFVPASNISLTD
jgi:hypothetical protein